MRAPAVIAGALALASVPRAAGAQAGDGQPVPARPGYQAHRFDEDWRRLCEHARVTGRRASDALKCVRIAPRVTLTLGADVRERAEVAANPGFGLDARRDHVVLHRAMAHADTRWGAAFRAFVQVGAFGQAGRVGGPAPTDRDRLDVVQGLVDLSARAGRGRATLRGGRQEMSFGSSRLVSVRDGPNIRRAFDALRLTWAARPGAAGIPPAGGVAQVDAFYARPVALAPGRFDDRANNAEAFWGVYATGHVAGPLRADLYAFGYARARGAFATGAGRERRQALGARLFGVRGGWDWDVEPVVQTGRFGGAPIHAWTVATDVGVTIAGHRGRPRLGIKADVASGDRDPADGRLGTFNALYPRLPYFSEANLVAPANVVDVHPSVQLRLTPTLSADLGWDLLWRQTAADAIYTPPLVPVAGVARRDGRFVGHQAIVGVGWRLGPEVTIAAQAVRFAPGTTLRGVGGRRVDFAFASVALRR